MPKVARRFLLSPKLVVGALVLGLSIGIPIGYFVPDSYALPCWELTRDSYNNAQYEVLVGQRFVFCDGTVYSWGERTQYAIMSTGAECRDCSSGEPN